MNDLQKKFEGRIWLKACEVKEITTYSYTTIARYREKEIIRSKRPYDGGNYLYWFEDVKKLVGW